MADKVGGKQPPNSLTSCYCIQAGNYDMLDRACKLAMSLEMQLAEGGACNTYVRTLIVMTAGIVTGCSHWPGKSEESVVAQNPDDMAEMIAAMIKLFVDTVNNNKGKWGIKINSVDLQTFERDTAEIIPMRKN